MQTETVLLIVAVVIILILAAIAGVLLYKVRQRDKEHEKLVEVRRKEGEAQRGRVNRSIQIIAQAINNEDITLTEASIRISVLLDSLSVDDQVREEFSAFYQLAEATNHIPILEAWKKLSPKEQFAFDQQRVTQETHFQEFVQDAAKRIQGRSF